MSEAAVNTAPDATEGRRVRPSSLPALAQCPDFTPDPVGRDYTQRGTERHASLAAFVVAMIAAQSAPDVEAAKEKALAGMDEEERDAIVWAAEYVQLHARLDCYPLEVEKRRVFVGPDFEPIPGTLDIRCGPDIFDFKWRFGDYWEQQAAYALTLPHDPATCHLLFGQPRKARRRTFTAEEAEAIVFPIIRAATDPARRPSPCDFCGWCAKRLTCPAITEGVQAAMMGRGDWGLKSWHVSEITEPEEMAKALRAARRLKEWCASAEFHAREMAIKQGRTLPGFVVKQRKGATSVNNFTGAFRALGMPQEEFFKACEVRLNTPMANNRPDPSRPGLVTLYARHAVLKESQAKREILQRLDGFLSISPPVSYLEEQNPAAEEATEPTNKPKQD